MTEPRHTLIVPIMRARVPVELRLEFPPAPDAEPVREPFAGDLYASYALELPDRYEYVARRHCAELGIEPGALRAQAAGNLRTRRPDLSMNWYPDAKAVSIGLGNDLEAGLLLDDSLMEKLAQDVEGDLVVAVPSREVFVATGTAHPDGLEKLRWAVDQVWPAGRDLLTRDLLVRRDASWEVFVAA
ncbi:DUF1444 family protein [Actinomadura sp. HBU206391]|uniref:DUF1444 family protein n=1 Tax=Actinomadura sp. HBU206391 TaxID=2731692 RepID=UPI00164FDB71|nr:DUF1444 family protein [Actinomadura sp. HBU206391]MBC6458253.1 DUF1444 family protein [Actinomadura sp. HBU206391]